MDPLEAIKVRREATLRWPYPASPAKTRAEALRDFEAHVYADLDWLISEVEEQRAALKAAIDDSCGCLGGRQPP